MTEYYASAAAVIITEILRMRLEQSHMYMCCSQQLKLHAVARQAAWCLLVCAPWFFHPSFASHQVLEHQQSKG